MVQNILQPIGHHVHGRDVIRQEMLALHQLSETFGSDFDAAVDLVLNTRGRIVVTGIGKSGHVGRKIAATFSATGSPAFFVHAAEAAHGDLGMIKPIDTLFILSNSGGTAELRAVIDYAVSQGVPIIGVTSRPESRLTRQATVALLLPQVPEACPEGIAPTTSTTMMLALGDALAIAALHARGMTRDDMALLHPGGSIGQRHSAIETLLSEDADLPLVLMRTAMRDVVLEMTAVGKGVAGVVDDDGHLVGVITDGDLRRSFDRILIATAADVMTRNPKCVPSGTLIDDARTLMQEAEITAIFVMARDNPRRPIGVLNIHELSAVL